ncbi:MAG: hypothetical protein EAY65_03795 [Alphaproteobacteria bacterium]|nr:MAG: hypothetical protein EAY65_03795 [Alphaproteobacteria bacterium]
MIGFLKALFGSDTPQEHVRRLTHPRDLRTGDIIKFGYLEQSDLSSTQFEVAQINTYLYGEMCYPELVLKDHAGNLIYMMVEEEDGEEYLALSKKIAKSDMNDVIGNDAMTRIMGRGVGTQLAIAHKPLGLESWMADSYTEVDDNVLGSFIKGDARYLSEEEVNRQEKFASHILEDRSYDYALEIEIYSSGEIELCATIYHDIDEIEEMWPSSTQH